jgi:hypothetical protein
MEKTLVMEIPSETKTDLFYGIFLDSEGCFSCDCKSYFYTSQKIENFRCKHIKQFLSVQEMRDL